MDTNSNSKVQKKTFIEKWLSDLDVEKIARDTEFYKASPRKISNTNLMLAFLPMALTDKNLYPTWAKNLGSLTGGTCLQGGTVEKDG